MAAEIRAERVKAVLHGEEVKTAKKIRRGQAERDKPFAGIADAYFEIKAPSRKDIVTDCNRKNAEFTKKKYGQFLPEFMTAAGNAAAKILAMNGLEKRF